MEKQSLSLIYENEEDDFIKSAIEYQERQIGMSRLRIEGLIKDLQNGIKEVRKLSPGVKKEKKKPEDIKIEKSLTDEDEVSRDIELLRKQIEKNNRRIKAVMRAIEKKKEQERQEKEKNGLPMGTKLIETQQELGNKLEALKNEGKGTQGVSSPA